MKEKLQLALGKKVIVETFLPNGANITILGKLSVKDDGGAYFVHPDLAACIIGFTPEQVSIINVDIKGDIWIRLK